MVALARKRAVRYTLPVYRKQEDFFRSANFITGFCAGRGSGKSYVGALKVLTTARDGERWMAVSPTYTVIEDTTWPTFKDIAKKTRAWISGVKSPTPVARFWTQDGGIGELVFRSADKPELLRGPSLPGMWYDEASVMTYAAFQNGLPSLRYKGRMGKCYLTFTPKGRRHWTFDAFYRELREDEDRTGAISIGDRFYVPKKNRQLIRAHTLENPFLAEEYYDLQRDNMTEAMALQELAGDFVDLQGLIFTCFWNYVDRAPRKAMRVRYWDRACLCAGTMVETRRGSIPIEKVRRGDFVLTRKGYRRVLWGGISKYVRPDELVTARFNNGSTLTGTTDHLVWTANNGWLPLAQVAKDSHTVTCINARSETLCQIPKHAKGRRATGQRNSSNLTESFTGASEAKSTLKQTAGIQSGSDITPTLYAGQCGVSTTERFQRGRTSTTKIRIETTTTLPTLNASHQRSMRPSTLKRFVIAGHSPIDDILKRHSEVSPHGEKEGSQSRLNARSVESCFQQSTTTQPECDSADVNAEAVAMSDGGEIPVYDLTVEGVPEFFANGILVHNCTPGGGKYTAGLLMARSDDGLFYVEDVVRGQWSAAERDRKIVETAVSDGRRYNNEVMIYAEQEGGSAGKEISEQFIKMLAGFPVYRDIVSGQRHRIIDKQEMPGEAKIIRAQPVAAQCEAGNVLVVRGPWNDEFTTELRGFPHYTFSDQVDAFSGAFNKLARYSSTDPGEVALLDREGQEGEQFGVTLIKSRQRRKGGL